MTQTVEYGVVIAELGRRVAAHRLAANLTQRALAEQAGVALRTVQRLEAGAVATHLSGFLRVCGALGLADRIDALVPDVGPGPMAQLRQRGKSRRRASGRTTPRATRARWTWGDES
jgi:transcriptional regulator with XRE-family HTH domain